MTPTLPQNQLFSSYDLGLASALVSLNFELVELDKSNPKKVQFKFKQTKGIDQAIKNYWNDNLPINARTLQDNQKMIKNRIFSQ